MTTVAWFHISKSPHFYEKIYFNINFNINIKHITTNIEHY